VVSLAKPQETVAVAVQRASIMLVTDHSGSMKATDVKPSRLAAAQRAARNFLDSLPSKIRVGVVAFSDTPDAVQAPSADHGDARRIIDAQVADGAPIPATPCRSPSTPSSTTSKMASVRHRRSCCSPTARPPPAQTRSRSPAARAGCTSRSTPSRWEARTP
jgi:hypothetical protein